MKVYQKIAQLLQAMENCQKSANTEWYYRHHKELDNIIKDRAPSGSGFDSGTKISSDSLPERLILNTSFHHMNDMGYYDGWTEHKIIITASLCFGFNLRVTGRDRNDIKEYIAEMFQLFLDEDIQDTQSAIH